MRARYTGKNNEMFTGIVYEECYDWVEIKGSSNHARDFDAVKKEKCTFVDHKTPLPKDTPLHEYLQKSGALFELNRLVLHPIGLALCLIKDSNALALLDSREDPEGTCFSESPDVIDLYEQYEAEAEVRAQARQKLIVCEERSVRSGIQSVASCMGPVKGRKPFEHDATPEDEGDLPVDCCWCTECEHCRGDDIEDRLSGPWPPKE